MTHERTFEDLQCWQACRALRLFVARDLIPKLPKEEQFRLKDQLLRAARSTTANIAEGYGRYHYQENAQFCRHARGSVFEVLDHVITAHEERLLDDPALEKTRHLTTTAAKLLNGFINYLLRSKNESTSSRTNEVPPEYLASAPTA